VLSRAQSACGEHASARATLDALEVIARDDDETLLVRAVVSRGTAEHEAELAAIDMLLERHNQSPSLLVRRVELLKLLGRNADAARQYKTLPKNVQRSVIAPAMADAERARRLRPLTNRILILCIVWIAGVALFGSLTGAQP
jgi:hypothetical protein